MKKAHARGVGSIGDDKDGNVRRISQLAPTVKVVSVDEVNSDHVAFATKHYVELINQLHAFGVRWGPNPHRAHLAVCQMREQLAHEIRARDTAIRRKITQEIRTRLYE